ncbi:hypothetical protein AHF37_02749 [Paragonimus kellicotti]|nr:hypothetical protein AHF37_02749 [Paragonimus kellicotti]
MSLVSVGTISAGEPPNTVLPPVCMLPSATTTQQPVQRTAPIISLPSTDTVAAVESTISSCEDSRPPTMLLELENNLCSHPSSLTPVTGTDTAKMLSVSSATANPISPADISTSHLDPSFISNPAVSSVFTSVPLCLPSTTILGIRPKPLVPQNVPSAHLVTATPTPVTTPLPSQSAVHLMPFVAASVGSPSLPNPPIPLGNLTGPTPGMPISGAVAPGTAGLQILNVTPMSPFVGTPGIVLHTAGTPNFQPATNPLLSGLPSAAALGGGTALNFLQPGPPTFATTLLQPPTGTPTDFMFEHTLGLTHSLGPAGSLTLINPGNPSSSVMESFATGPLSSLYPTLFHPSPQSSAPNHALLPTSTSIFIPPTYRQSVAGTTNLVNATPPQMSTSMTSGGLATGLFPGPSLSHANHVAGGAAAGTGLMFQPAPGPLLPPAFGLTSVSLLQSYPFPSYSFPFHGATDLTSLSVTAAPTVCSTPFPIYRPEDYNTRSSIPVCPVTLHPAPIMSCATVTNASLTSLPQPPALQPCPAVSKRLHRLPLSSTRTGSPTVTTMSGRHATASAGFSAVQHTVISSTVPGVLPRATLAVPGNIGIRAPNSTIVLPALSARRSRVLVKQKSVVAAAADAENTPNCLVPVVDVPQTEKVNPPVSSTCSNPVCFSTQAAVSSTIMSFKPDDSSQLHVEHTHPDLSPVVSEPICPSFDGQPSAPNKLLSTSSSPSTSAVLTTMETLKESKITSCLSETLSPTPDSNSNLMVTDMHNGVDQFVETTTSASFPSCLSASRSTRTKSTSCCVQSPTAKPDLYAASTAGLSYIARSVLTNRSALDTLGSVPSSTTHRDAPTVTDDVPGSVMPQLPGVLPRATLAVPGNIGIRAPNSTIVLPALRRRRSRVLVKPKSVVAAAADAENTPNCLVPVVDVPQTEKVNPPVSSTCSNPVCFSTQAAVSSTIMSFKPDDSSQLHVEHTHPDLSPVVSEPICPSFDGQPSAPNKLLSTSSSPSTSAVLTTMETLKESKITSCLSETLSPTPDSNSNLMVTDMHNGVDQFVEHSAATLNSADQHSTRSPSSQPCDSPVLNTFKSAVRESSSTASSPMPSSTGSTCSSPQSSSSPPADQRNTCPIVTTSTTNCTRTPLVKVHNGIHEHGELHTSMQRLGVSCPSTATGEADEDQVSPALIATGLLPVSRMDRRSTPTVPPPLLHHGPDDHRILTHVLDGHVIYESNRPFPVRNGMAVVEAALLQQCVREQAETTIGKSLAKATRTQPMDSEPMVNGHEPMQMDEEVLIKLSADSPGSGESNQSTRISRKPSRTYSSSSNSPSNLRCNHGPPLKRSLEPGSMSECPMINKSSEETTLRSDKTTPPTVRLATVSPPFTRPLSAGNNVDSQASIILSTKDDSSRVCQPAPLPYRSPTVARTSPGAVSTCTVIPDATHPLSLGFRSFPPPYAVAPQQPAPPPPGPVRHWTPDDVVTFVQGTPGCGAYASAFLTNEIDGEALLLLAKDQFIQPPIGMKIGPALKLAARLESIRHAN